MSSLCRRTFGLHRTETNIQGVQTLLLHSDSSYPVDILLAVLVYFCLLLGMLALLCVLQLQQYPAYERKLQAPLNSRLKSFILYLDIPQFTSLSPPCSYQFMFPHFCRPGY